MICPDCGCKLILTVGNVDVLLVKCESDCSWYLDLDSGDDDVLAVKHQIETAIAEMPQVVLEGVESHALV